jgi:hypothetical protein
MTNNVDELSKMVDNLDNYLKDRGVQQKNMLYNYLKERNEELKKILSTNTAHGYAGEVGIEPMPKDGGMAIPPGTVYTINHVVADPPAMAEEAKVVKKSRAYGNMYNTSSNAVTNDYLAKK